MEPFSSILSRDELILVSCCNVGLGLSRYSVAVITSAGIDWLDLDGVLDPASDKGVTGMAATDEHCFLAIPGSRERVISLDRNLRPVDAFTCEKARDLHSLAVFADRLYFASTATNQVLSIDCTGGRFTGPERIDVACGSDTEDHVHLNSVFVEADGTLLYTMFGVGPRTPVRDAGQVVDAGTNTARVDRLMDPHTVMRLPDGRLALCESMQSALCVVDPATGALERVDLRGYTRGIGATVRHVVVGSSRWRSRSRSSTQTRTLPGGLQTQDSHLFVLRDDLSLLHTFDFSPYASEIYDVAVLGSRFKPVSVFRDAAERRRNQHAEQRSPRWGSRLVRFLRG